MLQLYDVIECLPRDLTDLIEDYILDTCSLCGNKFSDVRCSRDEEYCVSVSSCPRCGSDILQRIRRRERIERQVLRQELYSELKSLQEKRLRKSRRWIFCRSNIADAPALRRHRMSSTRPDNPNRRLCLHVVCYLSQDFFGSSIFWGSEWRYVDLSGM